MSELDLIVFNQIHGGFRPQEFYLLIFGNYINSKFSSGLIIYHIFVIYLIFILMLYSEYLDSK